MKKLITFILLFSLKLHAEPTAEPLTPAETESLNQGQLVRKVKWTKDQVWPQVTIYSYIPHKAVENIAVFSRYEEHLSFVPDMLESKVLKVISPYESYIKATMKVPWPISKESHVTDNKLVKVGKDHYAIKWSLVSGDLLKDTQGFLDFEQKGEKTLFTYVTQITPNSSFAGLFKSRVADDVEKSVKKIIEHLGTKLQSTNADVDNSIAQMRKLLE